jgi:hypothetical protein
MPTNALYGDLQPVTERIGLTQRLDEERRAIVAQASDLTVDQLHARPLDPGDLRPVRQRAIANVCER